MTQHQYFQEKFLKYVFKDPVTGCWLWQRSCFPRGYGQVQGPMKVYTREQYAHRAAWVLNRGPISEAKPHILHMCDNPPCVRWTGKAHLFAGTNKDNVDDRVAKGRAPHGEQHHRATLLDIEAVEILLLFNTGKFIQKELALMFSTSQKMVCLIVNKEGRFAFLNKGKS